jgi:hypothetical protein
MKLAMPVLLFALIRNGLAISKYYHGARHENRKPALDPAKPPAGKADAVIATATIIDPTENRNLGSVMAGSRSVAI